MVKSDEDFELEFDDLALSDDFVTITLKELILVVYDSSGSMKETGSSGRAKYKEAEEAVNGFISRLKLSRAAASFSIALQRTLSRLGPSSLVPG